MVNNFVCEIASHEFIISTKCADKILVGCGKTFYNRTTTWHNEQQSVDYIVSDDQWKRTLTDFNGIIRIR